MTNTTETPNSSESSTEQAETTAAPATAQVETKVEATTTSERDQFHDKLSKLAKEPVSPEDSQPAKTEVESETKVDAEKDEPAKTEAEQPDPSVSSQEAAFDKRPEWAELKKLIPNAEEFKKVKPFFRKLLGAETHLRKQIDELKPSQAVERRIRAATGDEAGFNNAIGLIEQYANDPAASVPMLENLLRDARNRAGLEVSSPDLKEQEAEIDRKFEAGEIFEDDVKRQKNLLRETEKARAGKAQAENRIKATEQQEQSRTTEALIAKRTTALNEWEQNTTKRDPDFPKLKDLFLDRATMLIEAETTKKGRLLTAEEMVEQAEAAYQSVKTKLSSILPKPKPSRAVQGERSSTTSLAEPADDRERFHQELERRTGKR